MHQYAFIEEFARFEMVTYYTVKGEECSRSEADDFFFRMQNEKSFSDQLERLAYWMERIGDDEQGANFDLFRNERNCLALPPQRKYLDSQMDLRIYCHWVSSRIVILYNGGIKTTAAAQNCPNVKMHFYNAQSWTRQLKEIGIEVKGQEIKNLEGLYINY